MEILAEYGWLGWILIGGIAGALGKLLMPGKDGGTILTTILLGIAGALLMGFLGKTIGWYAEGEGPGFLAALVGSIVLLIIYRKYKKRSSRS